MTLLRHDAIEFTIDTNCFGFPVLKVRRAEVGCMPGDWVWSKWRVANLSERAAAIEHLRKLNK